MAQTSKKGSAGAVASPVSTWLKLTWDDLEEWAGPRSVDRGRSYRRAGRVDELVISGEGKLLAWVYGTERYATQVELVPKRKRSDRLYSQCTCPVGYDGCKHAVAVVAEYLEVMAQGGTVPVASDTDPRWKLIRRELGSEIDETEFDAEGSLGDFLRSKSADQLVEMLLEMAERYPEVAEVLHEQRALGTGDTDALVQRAREEIDELTSEPAWCNHWNDEGHLPDYSALERRFENLLENGQADALLELGRELRQRGSSQVEESHDEGETATAICACLEIVFKAVPRSTLPNPQKILYAIDASLEDDYDLCHGAEKVLNRRWAKKDWSAVANVLAKRLASISKPQTGSDFHGKYRRDGLTDCLIEALDSAGRSHEATSLCESEAPITGSYERLARRLIEEKRLDDAVRWANEGIEKTQPRWPGIASNLRTLLREIAAKRKDWPQVAAHYANSFFEHPSVGSLEELLKAAQKAKCADQARAAALRFLETGVLPAAVKDARQGKKPGAKAKREWPLPVLAESTESPSGRAAQLRSGRPEKHLEVLCQLAIKEKRPEEVIKWYDRLESRGRRSRSLWGYQSVHPASVAEAVEATHPERALAIHRQLAADLIAQTTPSSYQAAAPHLRKVRALLKKLGRNKEWAELIASIREQNSRKRRLMEVLDTLEGRGIIKQRRRSKKK